MMGSSNQSKRSFVNVDWFDSNSIDGAEMLALLLLSLSSAPLDLGTLAPIITLLASAIF